MSTDLVERLREFRRIGNYSPEDKLDPLLDGAIAEIERLRVHRDQLLHTYHDLTTTILDHDAEIERLHEKANMVARADFSNQERIAELEAGNAELLIANGEVAMMFCDAEELRVTNERLTTALRGLLDMLHETPAGHFKEVDVARAALEGKP